MSLKTMTDIAMELREIAYKMNITPESRHRMSKEIAEELLEQHGAGAYLYCVEKLANDTHQPRLWRDVLTYLDEIGVTDGGTVDTNDNRPREEHPHRADDDSENSHT